MLERSEKKWLATIVLVTIVLGAAFGAVSNFRANSASKWTETSATIVDVPSYEGTRVAHTQAKVETEEGVTAVVGVTEQARKGDTVTVWVSTETGAIWRTLYAGSSPVGNLWYNMIEGAFVSILIMFAMAFAATLIFLTVDSARAERRRRQLASGGDFATWD